MIFKPSSLHKLFFTYICPRFYGGAPPVPSNTTTTSTVNQSPWQNPVYQALMLGTKDKPGPITSMLRSSAGQTAAYNDMLKGGYAPVENQPQYSGYTDLYPTPKSVTPAAPTSPYGLPTAPTGPNAIVNDFQTAARGGIMSLQGYAKGKTVAKKETPAAKYARIKASTSPSAADTKFANTYSAAQVKALNKTPKKETAEQKADRVKQIISFNGTPTAADTSFLQNYNDAGDTDYKGVIDPKTGVKSLRPRGPMESSADYKKYVAESTASGAPPSKAVAEKKASENLKNTIGTSIKSPVADVKAKKDEAGNITGYESTNADFLEIQKKARELKTPAQYDAATEAYKKSTAGLEGAAGYKPTDVATKKADVTNANAASYLSKDMNAPTDIGTSKADVAKADATGYGATNMQGPASISAQRADVATTQGAKDVNANQLEQYQMQGPGAINAPTATAAQMAGPKSYLDQGTSEAYMSPYMQNVVDIQKRESNRDYEQELNKLNAQSVQAGAFGGSRQAIQRAEAARNQATRLGDIQAKGQQEAYASGMGQFNTETAATTDVGKANLATEQQTTLANQAAEIQTMMTNQGMDYNTALQNLQAKLGIQNTQAGNDLQADLANQQVEQQTQSTNTAAQNTASNAYVQNALEVAKVNYGGQLTAEQANKVATDAASQYNATNAQNVNLTNTAAQNTASNAYTQNQLVADTTNQQAGLTANQQGIGALQGIGQNAAGLTNTGTASNQAGIANLGAQGQVAQAEQAVSQQGMTADQQTAQNALGFTNQANAGVVAGVNSQPVQGGTTVGTATAAPASPFGARGGLIRNGKVVNRGKK